MVINQYPWPVLFVIRFHPNSPQVIQESFSVHAQTHTRLAQCPNVAEFCLTQYRIISIGRRRGRRSEKEGGNKIKNNFKFHKFIFHPDTPENIIKNYYKEIPHIATFSISMWNEQLSLKVAKILKDKFNTLIIFGGASCPHHPTDYFEKYPFIDIAIRAEGEDAFNEVLLGYLINKNDFSKIANVAFRDTKSKKCIINYEKNNFCPFNFSFSEL